MRKHLTAFSTLLIILLSVVCAKRNEDQQMKPIKIDSSFDIRTEITKFQKSIEQDTFHSIPICKYIKNSKIKSVLDTGGKIELHYFRTGPVFDDDINLEPQRKEFTVRLKNIKNGVKPLLYFQILINNELVKVPDDSLLAMLNQAFFMEECNNDLLKQVIVWQSRLFY